MKLRYCFLYKVTECTWINSGFSKYLVVIKVVLCICLLCLYSIISLLKVNILTHLLLPIKTFCHVFRLISFQAVWLSYVEHKQWGREKSDQYDLCTTILHTFWSMHFRDISMTVWIVCNYWKMLIIFIYSNLVMNH